MKRYWIVAKHELTTQLRRKSFIFFAFIFPLLMMGVDVGISYVTASQAEKTGQLGTIGYVDFSGILESGLEKPDEFQPYADEESARAALEAGTIGAYFVIPKNYISSGKVDSYTFEAIPVGIEGQLQSFLRANLLADRDPLEAERLRSPADVTMKTLDGRRELTQESALALILTPMIFAVVFGMSITMTSSYLMQNVAQEKETRMVELMMTSITPREMLWGKILGLGGLGLIQIVVWTITGAAIFIISKDAGEMLASIDLPGWVLGLAVLYLLLGYLLYGSLLAGIGASSSSSQEAQSISGVFSLLAMSPIFAFVSLLKDPNGLLLVVLSLIPFTAPTGMLMRVSMAEVPVWQIVTSIVLLVATSAVVVWLSAWVFRVGLLMTGKRLTLKTLWQVIRRGAEEVVEPLESKPAV